MHATDRHPAPTNEQSLFEELTRRVLQAGAVEAEEMRWTGRRTLAVVVHPDRWEAIRPTIALLQQHGADRGFKVLLLGTSVA